MQNELFPYTLQLFGEDLTKNIGESGRYFGQQHYCRSLSDAFEILLRIDIEAFDQHLSALAGQDVYYRIARVIPLENEESPLEIMRIPFEDSPEGEPAPGIYLKVPNEIADLETKIGIDLSRFQMYDPDIPFLLLARYKFDDQLQAVVDPTLEHMQGQLRDYDSQGIGKTADWKYKLRVQTLHHQDELTKMLQHNTQKRGVLPCDHFYYFEQLSDAFFYMLDQDFRLLDRQLSLDKGLGRFTEQLYIEDPDKIWVGVTAFTGIYADDRVNENGIYLKFYTPISELEHTAGLDLGPLGQLRDGQAYQQILTLSADRQELIIRDGYRRLYSVANDASPDQIDNAGRYLATAPFLLRVEWITGAQEAKPEGNSKVDYRLFVSQYDAFSALLKLDSDLFYPDRPSSIGQSTYIKNAVVYDPVDPRPIWSKFLASTDDLLPMGVYVRLHDDKVTFEALQMTLQRFSAITPSEGIHFLVGNSTPPPWRNLDVQRRQQRPPGRSGHSL